MTFPGFPCNDFDFHFAEAGSALAGLIVRDRNGIPVPGVLPSTDGLLTAGTGWTIRVAPFVASRTVDRAVLLGGTAEQLSLDVAPAPAANARIDVIYALPAEVGSGDPVEAARVAKGVPGAVPVKPSIPAGAIELGTYRSQAGQSSAAQGLVTNTFPFTATAGATILVRSAAALDALNLMNGSKAFDLATSRDYTRKGGGWVRDPIIWTGVATTPGSASAQSSVAVPFPTGLFPAQPVVTATPITAVPGSGDVKASVTGTTAAGTTLYVARNVDTATNVFVIAILS